MVTRVLTFTVVGDGTSDRVFTSIFEWLLGSKLGETPFIVNMAERLDCSSNMLAVRVQGAQKAYPSDVMLIHRDSENVPWKDRVTEIENAVSGLGLKYWIPVVPVRMTEAWILADSNAIRRAAGNPRGTVNLQLPVKARWESEPDPKQKLFAALRISSELNGRRLQKFSVHTARARIANLIDDFGYLRGLDSFDDFEKKLDLVLEKLNADMY